MSPINPNISLAVQPPQMPDLMQQMGQALSIKNLIQRNKMTEMSMKQMRDEAEADATSMGIINKHGGDLSIAIPEIINTLGPKGMGVAQKYVQFEKAWQGLKDDKRNLVKEKNKEIARALLGVINAPEESKQTVYEVQRQALITKGEDPNSIPETYPGDEWAEAQLHASEQFAELIKIKEEKRKEEEAKRKAALHQLEVRRETAKAGEAERELEAAAGDLEFESYYKGWLADKGLKRSAANEFAAMRDYWREKRGPQRSVSMNENQAISILSDANATEEEKVHAQRFLDMLEQRFPLTPEGLETAATQYAVTGQMPPMGLASSNLRAAIINKAAKMFPNINIGSSQAEFRANTTALNQLKKSYHAIKAFEATAAKNLIVLLDSAQNVLDTGSPMLNRPLRWISENVFGNENLPAFRAARQIDVNEIARIVTQPNMVGILTNEAREEISSLVPAQVTMRQLISVARLMRRDMNNRILSLEEEIGTLEGLIKTAPQRYQQQQPAQRITATNPETGERIESLDGGQTWQPITK